MIGICGIAAACSSSSGHGDGPDAGGSATGGNMMASTGGAGDLGGAGGTSGNGGAGGMGATGGSGGAGGSGGTGGMGATGGSGGAGGSGGTGGMGATGGSGGAGGSGSGLSVTDDFERASLGPDWAIVFPTDAAQLAQVKIFDNSDLGLTKGKIAFLLVDWKRDTFSADQYCEATIPKDGLDDWARMVNVRSSDPIGGAIGRPRYGFAYDNDPTQADFGNWVFKYDGVQSAMTRIIASKKATTPPKPGDTLRIEIVGYALKGYLNGDLVLEGTDSGATKIANGRPGLASRTAVFGDGTLKADAKIWESFAAGDM